GVTSRECNVRALDHSPRESLWRLRAPQPFPRYGSRNPLPINVLDGVADRDRGHGANAGAGTRDHAVDRLATHERPRPAVHEHDLYVAPESPEPGAHRVAARAPAREHAQPLAREF